MMSDRKRAIADHMRQANSESLPLLIAIPEASLGTRVYSEEAGQWTIREVVSHLADAEAGLLGQVRRLLKGEETVPPDFDLNRWNRSAVRRNRERTYPQLLEAIRTAFAEALATLEEVEENQLDLTGRHPSGETLTAEGYFRRMADHRLQHARDIRSALEGGSSMPVGGEG